MSDSQLSVDLDDDDDDDENAEKRGKRLRLRRYGSSSPNSTSRHRPGHSASPSPTPSRQRPRIPVKAIREKPKKPAAPALGKSIYVAGEAQESDEDDGFAFGRVPKDDGSEGEDDADNDKILEGLVNDEAMDAAVVAEEKVVEKYQ